MALTNFKLPTLASVALLTFSLNVFSAGICTPNKNEFQDKFSEQEETNLKYQNAREEGTFPETNEEYADFANGNVETLNANSELGVEELTGEALDSTEALVEEAAATTAETLGEALGPIGIVVMAAIVIWQIADVFSNPNSTTLEKVNALIGWTNPILGIILSGFDRANLAKKALAKAQQRIYNLNHLTYYEYASGENIEKRVLEGARPALETLVDKDAMAINKITPDINAKLSKIFQKEYLRNVDSLKTYLKQLFASRWIKASPIFKKLIDFMDASNNSGKMITIVTQDDQWHNLTDSGRIDSIKITGLDSLAPKTNNFGNEIELLNGNVLTNKSTVLDNTWIIGNISDPSEYLADSNLTLAARYFVITLRNTPNLDKGVEYRAYSIFNSDNIATLIHKLTTTTNFEDEGWTTTYDYTATGLRTGPLRVSVPIPSVISQQTIEFCGMDNSINFLRGKKSRKISKCLDDIFRDYKSHFSTYNLNHIVQIDVPGKTTINATFKDFLHTYGKSYNHLLAQTKISTINKFYAAKKPINDQSCQLYHDNAKRFLTHVDRRMTEAGRSEFGKEYNINSQGQSLDSACWKNECTKWAPITISKLGGGGKCLKRVTRYLCSITTYTGTRDPALDRALNDIHQQVDDALQTCRDKKDNAPVIFARQLTAQGNFYLDKNDFRVLFEEIFGGVRKVLIELFVKDINKHRLSKAQNTQ